MNDRNPFEWITDESITFLRRGYLSEGEEPLDRIKTISDHAEKLLGIEGFSDKFYDYMSRGWYSLASPVWANFGKQRGLPVSCFGSNIGDRESNLAQATMALSINFEISDIISSSYYETEPLYNEGQPDFLNSVVRFSTTLKPFDVLDIVQKVERMLGRPEKREKNRPRALSKEPSLFLT